MSVRCWRLFPRLRVSKDSAGVRNKERIDDFRLCCVCGGQPQQNLVFPPETYPRGWIRWGCRCHSAWSVCTAGGTWCSLGVLLIPAVAEGFYQIHWAPCNECSDRSSMFIQLALWLRTHELSVVVLRCVGRFLFMPNCSLLYFSGKMLPSCCKSCWCEPNRGWIIFPPQMSLVCSGQRWPSGKYQIDPNHKASDFFIWLCWPCINPFNL